MLLVLARIVVGHSVGRRDFQGGRAEGTDVRPEHSLLVRSAVHQGGYGFDNSIGSGHPVLVSEPGYSTQFIVTSQRSAECNAEPSLKAMIFYCIFNASLLSLVQLQL